MPLVRAENPVCGRLYQAGDNIQISCEPEKTRPVKGV